MGTRLVECDLCRDGFLPQTLVPHLDSLSSPRGKNVKLPQGRSNSEWPHLSSNGYYDLQDKIYTPWDTYRYPHYLDLVYHSGSISHPFLLSPLQLDP